mmetsp:Transcript_3370/g.5647  ORF Transcript_3370/g.5647 Transcript_3370/m.5647 type:complete len:138 (+) Transcript_3370:2850-3263(+)
MEAKARLDSARTQEAHLQKLGELVKSVEEMGREKNSHKREVDLQVFKKLNSSYAVYLHKYCGSNSAPRRLGQNDQIQQFIDEQGASRKFEQKWTDIFYEMDQDLQKRVEVGEDDAAVVLSGGRGARGSPSDIEEDMF